MPRLMHDAQYDRRAICGLKWLVENDVLFAVDRAHSLGKQAAVFAGLGVLGDALERSDDLAVISQPLITSPRLNGISADILKVRAGKM